MDINLDGNTLTQGYFSGILSNISGTVDQLTWQSEGADVFTLGLDPEAPSRLTWWSDTLEQPIFYLDAESGGFSADSGAIISDGLGNLTSRRLLLAGPTWFGRMEATETDCGLSVNVDNQNDDAIDDPAFGAFKLESTFLTDLGVDRLQLQVSPAGGVWESSVCWTSFLDTAHFAVGDGSDDGINQLQVFGSTSLDSGAITTDGDGNLTANQYRFDEQDPSVLIQGDEIGKGWIKFAPQDITRDSLSSYKGIYALRLDDNGNTMQGFLFSNPDLGTDEKMWYIRTNPYGTGGPLQFECANDDETAINTSMIMDRDGFIPLPVQFPFGVNFNGSAPDSPNAGDMYYDGADLKIYTGGAWKTVQVS